MDVKRPDYDDSDDQREQATEKAGVEVDHYVDSDSQDDIIPPIAR